MCIDLIALICLSGVSGLRPCLPWGSPQPLAPCALEADVSGHRKLSIKRQQSIAREMKLFRAVRSRYKADEKDVGEAWRFAVQTLEHGDEDAASFGFAIADELEQL